MMIARDVMQRIEVEVLSLNEALARMQSLLSRHNETSEYELLGRLYI
jgi:hypothetical protein